MFPTRPDFSQQWDTAPQLGGTSKLYITNEFHLGGLDIILPITVAGANSSAAVGAGLLEIIKNVRLVVADGSTPRNVFDMSGAGAIERHATLTGFLDRNTGLARNSGANIPADGAYIVTVPLSCLINLYPPFNLATLLPLPRYTAKPELVVNFSSRAEMTSDAGVTISFTSTPLVVLNRYRVPNNTPFTSYAFEVGEKLYNHPVTGQDTAELDPLGVYLDLLIRNFAANGTRQDILAGGEARLQRLGVNLARWTEEALRLETQRRLTFTPFTGVLLKNFLGSPQDGFDSLDSALDSGVMAGTGARINLIQNIGVASYQKIIATRVFGNIDALKRYKAADLL
jgi:hypothetical protein